MKKIRIFYGTIRKDEHILDRSSIITHKLINHFPGLRKKQMLQHCSANDFRKIREQLELKFDVRKSPS